MRRIDYGYVFPRNGIGLCVYSTAVNLEKLIMYCKLITGDYGE